METNKRPRSRSSSSPDEERRQRPSKRQKASGDAEIFIRDINNLVKKKFCIHCGSHKHKRWCCDTQCEHCGSGPHGADYCVKLPIELYEEWKDNRLNFLGWPTSESATLWAQDHGNTDFGPPWTDPIPSNVLRTVAMVRLAQKCPTSRISIALVEMMMDDPEAFYEPPMDGVIDDNINSLSDDIKGKLREVHNEYERQYCRSKLGTKYLAHKLLNKTINIKALTTIGDWNPRFRVFDIIRAMEAKMVEDGNDFGEWHEMADAANGFVLVKFRIGVVIQIVNRQITVLWLTSRGGRGAERLPSHQEQFYVRTIAANTELSSIVDSVRLSKIGLGIALDKPKTSIFSISDVDTISTEQQGVFLGRLPLGSQESLLKLLRSKNGAFGAWEAQLRNEDLRINARMRRYVQDSEHSVTGDEMHDDLGALSADRGDERPQSRHNGPSVAASTKRHTSDRNCKSTAKPQMPGAFADDRVTAPTQQRAPPASERGRGQGSNERSEDDKENRDPSEGGKTKRGPLTPMLRRTGHMKLKTTNHGSSTR